MHYIPSKKLNEEPIRITLSGVGHGILFHHPDAHKEYIWNKLAGSGVNRSESDDIATSLRRNFIKFVPSDDSPFSRGYIRGKLVETPTQHILWVVSPPCLGGAEIKRIREEEGYGWA